MASTPRVNLGTAHPSAYKALIALSSTVDAAAAEAGLDARLVDLVKLRVSQINGCAFCCRMHTADALAAGEAAERIAVLPAWRETSYFSAAERAALELAESVTLVAGTHVDDEAYAAAAGALAPEQVSAAAWVATVMNAFNRVAITSRYAVGPQ